MKTYLQHTDADAFVDHPKSDKSEAMKCGLDHLCPKCKGHGGWNLELNAYPLRGMEDTPENRHKYSHFRANCNHCNGWGYVVREDADHTHEWEFVKNMGRCLNLHRCNVCGKEWQIDSSD